MCSSFKWGMCPTYGGTQGGQDITTHA